MARSTIFSLALLFSFVAPALVHADADEDFSKWETNHRLADELDEMYDWDDEDDWLCQDCARDMGCDLCEHEYRVWRDTLDALDDEDFEELVEAERANRRIRISDEDDDYCSPSCRMWSWTTAALVSAIATDILAARAAQKQGYAGALVAGSVGTAITHACNILAWDAHQDVIDDGDDNLLTAWFTDCVRAFAQYYAVFSAGSRVINSARG